MTRRCQGAAIRFDNIVLIASSPREGARGGVGNFYGLTVEALKAAGCFDPPPPVVYYRNADGLAWDGQGEMPSGDLRRSRPSGAWCFTGRPALSAAQLAHPGDRAKRALRSAERFAQRFAPHVFRWCVPIFGADRRNG